MSGFRRHIMAKLAQQEANQEYILIESKTGVTGWQFRVRLDGSDWQYITAGTDFSLDDDGVKCFGKWYVPVGKKVTQIQFSATVTGANVLGIQFSDGFDFTSIDRFDSGFAAVSAETAFIQYVDNIQFPPQCTTFRYMFRYLTNSLRRITFKKGVVNSTIGATTIERMFHLCNYNFFDGDLSWLSVQEGCDTGNWNTGGAFLPGDTNAKIITAIGDIKGSISFRYHQLTLDSAIVVLNAMKQPTSPQTLTFHTTTWTRIQQSPEALALVAQRESEGWTFAQA